MQSVITLLASEVTPLSDSVVADVLKALDLLGAGAAAPDWLADDIACDIAFGNLSEDQAESAARQVFADQPWDVIAQPIEGRRKALLLADMDSTIVTSETLDDLAAFVGLKDKIAAITERAMNGELDFEAALKERVGMLEGLDVSALEDTWSEIKLSPGAETLVRTMSANGAHCVLVSGGFKFFTTRVREVCGFHEDLSNDLIIADGKLTGDVTEPILDKEVKLATLIDRASKHQLSLAETITVGDGANDLPMLKGSGLGIAYRGKPSVRAEAPARLDHADLRGLLYAQGYRAEEFVA